MGASSLCIPTHFDFGIEESSSGADYTPGDLRKAYSLPSEGGSSQTVAVVVTGGDPHAEADLAKYRSEFSLSECKAPTCFQNVDEHGGTSYPVATPQSEGETAIDLEMVSAVCPECHLILVQAKTGLLAGLTGDEEAKALNATVISNSWGAELKEEQEEGNLLLEELGVPLTAAAGDLGYDNYLGTPNTLDYPASSPDVVAVGGTTLEHSSNARGWTDTVWTNAAEKEATASGCSVELKPAWQSDECAQRMVADVAIVAEGVAIYNTASKGKSEARGTSVGAPLVAGIIALSSEHVRKEGAKIAKVFYLDLTESVGTVLDVVPVSGGSNTNYNTACSPSYECTTVAGEDGASSKGYDGPTGVGVPQGLPSLASWSEQTMPAAAPEEEQELYGVACASSNSCTAAGAAFGTQLETLAEHWNGIEWSVESTPNPAGEGAALLSVSCPSTSSCYSGGYYESGSRPFPLILRWNGTSWSEELPSYSGYSTGELTGTACSSSTACTVVGAGEQGSTRVPLAELWNGTSWSVQEPPLPGSALTGELLSISCSSAAYCIAVGDYSTATHTATLAEKWNGTNWTTLSTNNGSATEPNYLDGVSCWSEKLCMGVGYYGSGGKEKPLAEAWDGSLWSTVHTPPPSASSFFNRVRGISCASATACTAAGERSGKTVVAAWNGVSWSLQKLPPELEQEGLGLGVSCSTSTECTLVGTTWETGWDEARAGRFTE
jgi:hypothetical protein